MSDTSLVARQTDIWIVAANRADIAISADFAGNLRGFCISARFAGDSSTSSYFDLYSVRRFCSKIRGVCQQNPWSFCTAKSADTVHNLLWICGNMDVDFGTVLSAKNFLNEVKDFIPR